MRGLFYVPQLFAPLCGSALVSAIRSTRPRKSLGQHFLSDSRIAARIVDAAQLTPADTVVEIGPGRGVLTRRLVSKAGRVVAVELDERLCEELPSRLDFPDNLDCVHVDARKADLSALAGEGTPGTGSGYKVIGNLPYYAANPIIRLTLESEPPPVLALFMVQREVADSMTAQPGSMTMLSVATQYFAEARTVCSVSPSAFRPAPKVRSAVVRLDVRKQPAVDVADRQMFFDTVRAGFSAPRKQLHNSLGHGLKTEPPVVAAMLERAEIDGRRRPATLSLEEWARVCAIWQEIRGSGLNHRAV